LELCNEAIEGAGWWEPVVFKAVQGDFDRAGGFCDRIEVAWIVNKRTMRDGV